MRRPEGELSRYRVIELSQRRHNACKPSVYLHSSHNANMGHLCSKLLQPLFLVLLVGICITVVVVLFYTLYPITLMKLKPVPSHCIPRLSSKDIIFRSAYFDSRPRHGHTNASVFILEVKKTVLGSIVGCKVGENVAKHFKVRLCDNNRFHHHSRPHLTHDQVMMDCYDLPGQNGSRAFVMYKVNTSVWLGMEVPGNYSSKVISVESERPLFIPWSSGPKVDTPEQEHVLKVAVCAGVLYDNPPLLSDWLRYQRAIGVLHVHIVAEESFRMGGGQNEYFRQAMSEGFVTLAVWHPWLNECETLYHSQMLAYEDCVYRLQGTYDYILMIDVDDFFVPLVIGQPNLSYYARNWCHQGSCIFQWIEFYPDCGLKSNMSEDGNITSLLLSSVHRKRIEGKSLHRLSAIVDAGIHRAAVLMAGYQKTRIPRDKAYVAHIRKGRVPSKC